MESDAPRENKGNSEKNKDEDKLTLKLMKEHGINNVRGGSWCMVKMRQKTFRELEGLISKEKISHLKRRRKLKRR